MKKMLGELLEKYTEEELSLFVEMMLEECKEEKKDERADQRSI